MADETEAKGPKSNTETGLKSTVRALRHRNFQLFFGGQSISLIGSWMQRIALAWAVYRLTNSPFLLGFVGFAGEIPIFILAPFAGVMADRWNRQRLLILTQTLATVQAFALSALVLTETALVWHFVVLSVFLGIVNAFDIPIRQSFIVEMVGEKEDLGNAIALNSSMVNVARLLGPSVAGLLIAAVGEGQCFLVNGFSYLPVIAALIAMKIQPKNPEAQSLRVWQQLKAGLRYASGFAPIRAILLLLGLVSLMGMPYTVLMPIFARDVLHGGPHALGFLMGAVGMGALVGAFYLASRKTVLGLGRMIVLASSLFGLGLIAFAFSRVQWFSLVLMFITGLGQMVQMASSNTILQTIVDDDKRGRIMSFYTMAFRGMAPFGSLFAGSLANKIGAPGTVFIGGITCLLGAALFLRRLPALREMVRPIYLRMGIVSEMGLGIQSTTELTVPNKDHS
jgi:MFS family permease